MKSTLLCLLLLSSCSSPVEVQDSGERFFDWTALSFPRETYAARRAQLGQALGDKRLFLCPSADGFTSGETFRQLDDFLYYSGLELPNSMLVVRGGDQGSVLFAPRTDRRFESDTRTNDFPGRPLALDPELARRAGIEELLPMEELEGALRSWIDQGYQLHINAGRGGLQLPEPQYVRRYSASDALQLRMAASFPEARIGDAHRLVASQRMVKDAHEIERIRQACRITSESILESAAGLRPGVDERSLEGTLEAGFKRRGAQRVAFDSIIKSGPNSLWPWRILAAHYDRRNRQMKAGELVIYDVGCELDHYASDMGRTFPVSGRFTEAQARRLEMITAASDAVIAAIRPGVRFAELREVLLAKIPAEEQKYMQASLFFGHHIGLNVGDPSLPDVPLEPGMIFTVEPWYYNHDEQLAVFIEDNILVTAEGAENLSALLPRSPAALEALTGAGR